MARPHKIGLDYFPLDTNISDDDKIFYIESNHGLVGFSVYIKLLTRVYDNGYFVKWDKFRRNVFSRKVNVDINTLKEVVSACLECGLFNKNLYEKYEILSSKSIQNRYFKATSRRTNVDLIKKYSLIDVNEYKNINLVEVSVNNNPKLSKESDEFSTQSKVKESKEENSKGKNRKGEVHTPEESGDVIESNQTRVEYVKVINLYNKILGGYLPNVEKLTDKRKNKIRIRWNDGLDDLDQWQEVFEAVLEQPFLLGEVKEWRASLDWLIQNDTNHVKVLERFYLNDSNKSYKQKVEEEWGEFING